MRPRWFLLCCAFAVLLAPGARAQELCDGRDDDGDGTLDAGCPSSCADPRALAAEVAISPPDRATTLGRDRALTWDGHGFGAVFSQAVGSNTQIRFRRLDPGGVPLAPPLPVSAVAYGEVDAVIDWSGSGYGIAWAEEDFGLPRMMFAFVDAAGQLAAGPVPVGSPEDEGQRPSIGWDGEAFVIAWSSYNTTIQARRVSPGGVLLGDETCISCAAPAGADEVAVAVAPGQVGYAWADGHGVVRLGRSDALGQPVGAPAPLNSGNTAAQPALAWGAAEWLAAWHDRRTGVEAIYIRRIGPDGTPLGTEQRIDGAESYASQPSLAWTGTEYIVAWVGGTSGALGLRLRRLDAQGVPLAPVVPLAVPSQPGFPDFRASLAWTGSRPALLRDEQSLVAQRPIRAWALECCADADGDGVNACDGDADDGDALAYPGAAERCNGRDDDLDGSMDEGCDRSCVAPPLVGLETRGAQDDESVGLAIGGEPVRACLARAADGPGTRLALERGGPPWSLDLLEQDPAPSGQPAVAWTGAGAAVLFTDHRSGAPRLRFSARAEDGAPIALDLPLEALASNVAPAGLAWSGRRLAAAWLTGEPPAPRTGLLTDAGAPLGDGLDLGPAAAGTSAPSIAVAPDEGGGTVVAWIEADGAVRLERRDDGGGRRGARVTVAAPGPARADIAVVAANGAHLVTWSGAAGAERAVVRRDGTIAAPPATLPGIFPAGPLALAYTGEEVTAVYVALDSGGTRLYRTRIDAQGQLLCPGVPVGDDRPAGAPRAAWDGTGVRLAWTRASGSTREVRTARLDCAAAPVPGRVTGLHFRSKDEIAWSATEASAYDVVSGDPRLLAAGYAVAIDACEASRTTQTTVTLPARGTPRFWLVRAVLGDTRGSYDEDGRGQLAPRDDAIALAPATCP